MVGVGPQVEVARDELAAIVDPDRLGIADLGTDPFQCPDHILAAVGEARVGCWTKTGMRVDDRQDPQLVAEGELVMNKIHGPDIVRPDASWRSSRSLAFTRRFGSCS